VALLASPTVDSFILLNPIAPLSPCGHSDIQAGGGESLAVGGGTRQLEIMKLFRAEGQHYSRETSRSARDSPGSVDSFELG
jgi:hypothetical protein